MTYGNGDTVSYTYDALGRKTGTTTSDGDSYAYTYTGDGQLYEMRDVAGSTLYRYTYDTIGRLIRSSMKKGNNLTLQTRQKYNDSDQLTKQTWAFPDVTYSTNYSYDEHGRLHQLYHTLPTGTTYNTITYDDLGRTSMGYTTQHKRLFTYAPGANANETTGLVSQYQLVTTKSGGFATKTYNYTYDDLGNIATVTGPEGNYSYTYDAQGQLTAAIDSASHLSWDYSYDTYGNIREKYITSFFCDDEVLTYTYGNSTWRDKLTALSVTRDGTTTGGTYTYDASGNPTGYFNPGDLAAWTMTWRNGRELASATKTGTAVSYDYDVNGLRTEKTVNGVTHTYLYASGKLLRDSWTESGTSCSLDFFYDYAGQPYVVFYQKGAARQRFYYLNGAFSEIFFLFSSRNGASSQCWAGLKRSNQRLWESAVQIGETDVCLLNSNHSD